MLPAVDPLLQRMPVDMLDVNTTDEPAQKVSSPVFEITGGLGLGFTVTCVVAEAAE